LKRGVIPAEAGIQKELKTWIRISVGMTESGKFLTILFSM
jgi:hypothetical protein